MNLMDGCVNYVKFPFLFSTLLFFCLAFQETLPSNPFHFLFACNIFILSYFSFMNVTHIIVSPFVFHGWEAFSDIWCQEVPDLSCTFSSSDLVISFSVKNLNIHKYILEKLSRSLPQSFSPQR